MNSKQKFENFLESLKGKDQDTLIESVKQGFRVCFEEMGDLDEDEIEEDDEEGDDEYRYGDRRRSYYKPKKKDDGEGDYRYERMRDAEFEK